MLFVALTGKSHRVTRDLDLLGYGDASAKHIAQVFRQISKTSVEPDGMVFDPEGITVQAIREDQVYESQRVRLLSASEKGGEYNQVWRDGGPWQPRSGVSRG